MSARLRDIVIIDEDLCDGCGDCVPSCDEGAIQIIDGKAKLVAENLCDGFGNCLGVCPQGAITIEKREADAYDEQAVDNHLETLKAPENNKTIAAHPHSGPAPISLTQSASNCHSGGCPGSAIRDFTAPKPSAIETNETADRPTALRQWPVQLMLVPPTAPFLQGREILLAADCCPFALNSFHENYLAGRSLLVGCPKLDNLDFYREKLTEVFAHSGATGVTVMTMEVPCCFGLKQAAIEAAERSGKSIPVSEVVVSVQGEILKEQRLM